ncbi:uncharacterized protein LTR77_007320 [Saxophila tyrrhenica]|uniref:RING-type domain-containing protein n=1 Tax=Saxophila tyrrhenica TaxID=1690608 RepID=A0AAV9P4E1_9PEZI|nr:hypothetical protein LTR77_007320 [Saxophila tyrrhenica]
MNSIKRTLMRISFPFLDRSTLAGATVGATAFFPLTGLYAAAIASIYLFLRHEHRFNRFLLICTPPAPDAHLPSRKEWTANGGLKPVPPGERRDDEHCPICYDAYQDPMQIKPCGHIFCKECVDAWHERHSTCPQCTITLWRSEPSHESRLEKLAMFTAAEAIVAYPLTPYALGVCLAHHFSPFSGPVSTVATILIPASCFCGTIMLFATSYGLTIMLRRRRAQGGNWWGGELDEQMQFALGMSFWFFSIVLGWWVLGMAFVVGLYSWGTVLWGPGWWVVEWWQG